MAAWFGKKNEEPKKSSDESADGKDKDMQMLNVTDAAHQKIVELIRNTEAPVLGIRIIAEATSPTSPEYSLAFVQEGEDFEDDTILEYEEYRVFIDPESVRLMDGVRLDFLMQGGFRIDRPVPDVLLEGPVAEKLQKVINDQINPALALHGGFVQLIDVKDDTAYIELGGGCKGCGMVDVTLKQGIEVMIKQHVPEIKNILDSTDHASGTNPYYQPSK